MNTISEMVSGYEVATVVERLRAAEVPVAPVLHPHEVCADPHVTATGLLRETRHPVVGSIRHPGPASRYFGVDRPLRPAPKHGEHSVEILRELGRDEAAIENLLQSGQVRNGA